jgi:hypothetical protein
MKSASPKFGKSSSSIGNNLLSLSRICSLISSQYVIDSAFVLSVILLLCYAVDKSRASWNPVLEKSLVELLHEHNTTYHRSQNGWSTETWNMMVSIFQQRHPHVKFTKSQVQDKEKDLKRDYQIIKETRKQSGVGWNEAKCMLLA